MKLYRHVKELFQEELGVPFVCEELESLKQISRRQPRNKGHSK
jgi:hypothetical protein